MSVDWQTISIPFGKGESTKPDPKMLPPTKLVNVQNAVFTNEGRLTKRNGYTPINLGIIGGGTISSPVMVQSIGSSLRLAASGYLYDFAETSNLWRNAGKWDSIKSTNQLVSGAFQLERNSQSVVSGNFIVITYDNWLTTGGIIEGGSGTSNYLSVLDTETNTYIASDKLISSFGRFTRPFLFGDGNLGVFYINGNTNDLCFRTISISSGVVTIGSEVDLIGVMTQYNGGGTQYNWVSYDLAVNGNNAAVIMSITASGGVIQTITINSSGGVVGSGFNITGEPRAIPLSAITAADGKIWIYWGKPASASAAPGATTQMKYAIIAPSGSTYASVLGPTAMAGSYTNVRQVTPQIISNTVQNVYFSTVVASLGDSTSISLPAIFSAQNNTTGTVTNPFQYQANVDIFGKVFTQNGNTYLPVVLLSQDQNTGFLIDLSDAHPAAKFLVGTAEGTNSFEWGDPSSVSKNSIGGYWWRYPGFLTSPKSLFSNQTVFASGKILQSVLGPSSAKTSQPAFIMGACLVTLTWNDIDAFQSDQVDNITYLNGSIPSMYDGNTVSEIGFSSFPELTAVSSTSGGSMSDGSYEYQSIYEWADNAGNLYQSETSVPITNTITGGGGSGSVALTIKGLNMTQKGFNNNTINLKIYRTVSNGTIPYLLTQFIIGPLGGSYSYTDNSADSSLNTSQPIYTNASAILSNSPPPCSMIFWLNNNRLWLVDSENPETNIWYSKTISSGNGIEFSAELLNVVDSRLGNIIAGQPMDEKTVIFKQNGLLYFVGDGADDSGSNSTLSLSIIIPSDVGGSNSKAVILYPGGILFRTSNNKGIYLLSRGIQLTYLGADVEALNSQDIQNMKILPSVSQIRILTSSGTSIVYDYFYQQWGTFTGHTGLSSAVWNGNYVYVTTGGALFQEDPNVFLDNSTQYALSATTSWLKAGTIQGFQRVRRAAMLGDYSTPATGYSMQISAAYDFSTTFQPPVPFGLGTSTNTPFQYRERLPIQKCDTIQLKIEELPTGASGQFIDFSDLGLEIGMKRGLNRLSSGKSVG